MRGGIWKAARLLAELVNDLAAQANIQTSTIHADQVTANDGAGTAGRTGCNMVVDNANAENVQWDNAFWFQKNGIEYYKAVDAEIDLSAEATAAGDTVAASGSGAFWGFVNTAGTPDFESNAAAQDFASAIIALAQYSLADNTLPPGSDDVACACIQITEVAGGGYTFGTDSITAETETYYSFQGLPAVESAMASFALDAAAATFTYGAADVVLGTGVRVVATGKANVAFTGTTQVARGKVGAYLFYVLADDSEVCLALGSAYSNLQAAKDAVRDAAPNPLMPLVGVIYVSARKQAFTPGTTLLDAAGLDVTFVTNGPGANQSEQGRAQLGTVFTAVDDIDTVEGIL